MQAPAVLENTVMDMKASTEKNRPDHNTESGLCFVTVLERFVKSATVLEETVLFPSVLMDLSVNALEAKINPNEIYLYKEMDLRTFCRMVKSLRIQLLQGCSFIEEGLEENKQIRNKVEELCLQLKSLTQHAKYLRYASKEIAFSKKPVSFQEYNVQTCERMLLCEDHSTCNLRDTLQMFLNAVEEMEKETLFPCLLKSFRTLDYGCSMNSEQNLNDLFVRLLQVRTVLLAASYCENFDESAFCQIVTKPKNVFNFYAIMVEEIIVMYRRKIHEDY